MVDSVNTIAHLLHRLRANDGAKPPDANDGAKTPDANDGSRPPYADGAEKPGTGRA
jgi:hypothetical protein